METSHGTQSQKKKQVKQKVIGAKTLNKLCSENQNPEQKSSGFSLPKPFVFLVYLLGAKTLNIILFRVLSLLGEILFRVLAPSKETGKQMVWGAKTLNKIVFRKQKP